MAELFTGVLNQLGSLATQLAQHEINLIVGVEEEVQKLQHSFTMVQAMLNNAEERQFMDEKVKPWLDQLKDVYYMMDDVLDSWKTRSQIQKEDEEAKETDCIVRALKKEVCSFFPSPSCCLCQLDKVSLRSEIGHKIENLKQTLDNILKDKEMYGIDLNIQSGVDLDESLKTTAYDIDVSDIVGRNKEWDELLELLKISAQEERKPRVISLVGMSGVGKSTLAQLAYHHLPKEAHFQIKLWVSVSIPFNKLKVAKAIIESIEQKSPNIIEFSNLVDRICELIAGKKFFLVLDNVWLEQNSSEWDPIKNALQFGAKDSRILVTTRNNEVAKMMGCAQTHIITLGQLSKDDCLLIFNKYAFVDDKLEQHKHLENLGEQLADKCNGLPLAARTLGSLMRNKRSIDQWNNILDILNSSLWKLPNFPKDFAPFLLSYYELPLALKHCFSYCAIFSKDHYFVRDELVLLWMAQVNINSKAQMEMEIMVEEYFEYLATRSFFQDFKKDESDDKIIGCKMHYIVHEFAKLITQKECFEINGDNYLEVDVNKSARHLQLKISKELKFPKSLYKAERLRTLFLLSNERDYDFFSLLSNSFQHFRYLRTLILDCPIKKLPKNVGNLIHLRCLFMSNDAEIEQLPKAICNLSNLQSLSIKNFRSLKKLPLGMGKLINLRHLILSRYISLSRDSDWDHVVFPKGIENLTSLRTLSDLNLVGENNREGCKIGELKNLNKLRGILRIRGLRNVVDKHEAENAQLKKKVHLRGLELWFGSSGKREVVEDGRRIENDVSVLNALEPPPKLNSLLISDYMGTTVYPNWMMSLTTLKTLHLFVCQKLEHLPPLGKLPSLESLYISGVKSLKKVGVEFLGIESKSKYEKGDMLTIFPKLKSLEFRYLEEWKEWTGIGGKREEEEKEGEEDNGFAAFATKIMPHLDFLRIWECHKLNSLPDFLRAPSKTLRIYGNPRFDQRVKFVSVIMEEMDPLNRVIQSKLQTS